MQYAAPTGSRIIGTADILSAVARINGIDENGEPEYEGETLIDWDSQTTRTRQRAILFQCESGQLWTFDQLACIGEDDDDAEVLNDRAAAVAIVPKGRKFVLSRYEAAAELIDFLPSSMDPDSFARFVAAYSLPA